MHKDKKKRQRMGEKDGKKKVQLAQKHLPMNRLVLDSSLVRELFFPWNRLGGSIYSNLAKSREFGT